MSQAAFMVTLPVRLGIRAAGLALSAAQRLAGLVVPGQQEQPPAQERPAAPARPATTAREPRREPPRRPEPEPEAPPPPPRVTEEAEPVAEFADAGAENGAGPEVSIAEPWEGYDRMTARDIIEQLGAAQLEMVAAVRLYESSTRSRRTVLEAADRRLR